MRILSGWDKLREQIAKQGSVLSVGSFDGIHLGHQKLLQQLTSLARRFAVPSLVLSFQPHPRVFFQNKDFALINSAEDKISCLKKFGIDNLGLLPFNQQLANLSALEFAYLLKDKLNPRAVVVGKNHSFGLDRQGGVTTLQQIQTEANWQILVVEDEFFQGEKVSSSLVRRAMQERDIPRVNALLNRVYSYAGIVVKGQQKGRTLGFPTANIFNSEPNLLCPPQGVYAVRVQIEGENELLLGMLNIGLRPTFNTSQETVVEVYILNFNREIYGARLRVFFYEYLRSEQRFPHIQALISQLQQDKANVEKYFKTRVEID